MKNSIKNIRENNGLSLKQLSEKTAIKQNRLKTIEENKKDNLTIIEAQKICDGLGKEFRDVFRR